MMNDQLIRDLAHARIADLHQEAQWRRLRRTARQAAHQTPNQAGNQKGAQTGRRGPNFPRLRARRSIAVPRQRVSSNSQPAPHCC
ncbi:hypothetical protein [Actinopolymorpha alba]|uniref:hypothetical protein n=1 Tax=Actinopolymorpha alba TaxID=533267 RepID=UPI000399F17D|nr:hypothetical protein [Actinopolymorpha alba]